MTRSCGSRSIIPTRWNRSRSFITTISNGVEAVLLVAAHVQMRVIGPSIGQSVNQPRVSMEGEDDRFVSREERIEFFCRSIHGDAPLAAGVS